MGTHCRQELNGGSLPLFQKFFLLYRVLELQDREVQFDGCLCIPRLQVVIQEFSNNLPAFLHQVFLLGFIRDIGKGLDIAGQFPDFGKCFNDGQGGLNCLRAFKDGIAPTGRTTKSVRTRVF